MAVTIAIKVRSWKWMVSFTLTRRFWTRGEVVIGGLACRVR